MNVRLSAPFTRVAVAMCSLVMLTAIVATAHAQTPATPTSSAPAPANAAPPAPAPAVAPPVALPVAASPATLVVDADADDLLAEIKAGGDTRLVGLKKGPNKQQVPAGSVQLSIATKAGRQVSQQTLDLAAGAERTVSVASRGRLIVQVPVDADVAVDGKDIKVEAGQFAADFEPGAHTLVVQRPGQFGQRGPVEVQAGKTSTVAPQLQGYDAGGKKTWAWAAMITGGALIVGTVIVDATNKFDEFGGDATRWTLFGLGSAGFVGGTVLLKHAMDETPPVQDTKFGVQVARTRGGAMASLAWKF